MTSTEFFNARRKNAFAYDIKFMFNTPIHQSFTDSMRGEFVFVSRDASQITVRRDSEMTLHAAS